MKNTITSIAFILMASLLFVTSATTAHAKNKFGAIAISPSSKAMGWSYNYNSKWKANQVALNKCRKYASDCKIGVWFRNACGAVAVGANGGWGAHWGNSVKSAKWKAKKTCRKYDSYCKVKRLVCTDR
jgi:serine/threonine-protein kinase